MSVKGSPLMVSVYRIKNGYFVVDSNTDETRYSPTVDDVAFVVSEVLKYEQDHPKGSDLLYEGVLSKPQPSPNQS